MNRANLLSLLPAAVLCFQAACGDGDGGGFCDRACSHMVQCGDIGSEQRQACIDDCTTEPWPPNVVRCREATCGLTDLDCEKYGEATCAEACDHMVECGELAQTGRNSCVADCESEQWPGNYRQCRATTCGKTDSECESFDG